MQSQRQVSIRRLLAAVMIVPMLLVALLSGKLVLDVRHNAAQEQNNAALAIATNYPAGLVEAIFNERNEVAIRMIGLEGIAELPVTDTKEARRQTDAAIKEFSEQITDAPQQVQRVYGPVLRKIQAEITETRNRVDAFTGVMDNDNLFADTVYDMYTKPVDLILQTNDKVVRQIPDPQVRNLASANASALRYRNITTALAKQIAWSELQPSKYTEAKRIQTNNLYAAYLETQDSIRADLADDRDILAIADTVFTKTSNISFNNQMRDLIAGNEVDLQKFVESSFDQDHPMYSDVSKGVVSSISEMAHDNKVSATTQQTLYTVIFLVGTFAIMAFGWFAAKNISMPLVRLSHSADHAAHKELPEIIQLIVATPTGEDLEVPKLDLIDGSSIGEIDDLAESLNDMNNQSLNLAVEQAGLRRKFAESFASLGHRVSILCYDILSKLEAMESDEEDTDKLTDLFELDHTATQIMRNSKSLVLLAGPEDSFAPTTERSWSSGDVVRSAIQASIDYQKVDIASIASTEIVGWAGGEVANMLSEFVDNAIKATQYVDDPSVSVMGEITPDGSYAFRVIDNGVGMSKDIIRQANRRLSATESFTEAPSKYLGHFVIGYIAKRIGVRAGIFPNDTGRGITAAIILPNALTYTGREVSDPELAPGSDAESSVLATREARTALRKLREDNDMESGLDRLSRELDPEQESSDEPSGKLPRRQVSDSDQAHWPDH